MGDIAILVPAFVAGALMLLIHVPLGREVLRRGAVFIDLSLAQLAAMGAIFAEVLGMPFFATQASAFFFAFLGALLFKWLERKHVDIEKAINDGRGNAQGKQLAAVKPSSTSLMLAPSLQDAPPEVVRLAVGVSLIKWNEVAIGCTFVLSTAFVLLVLSVNPHGAEHINNILSGQLLLADWGRILFSGGIFIVAAALVYSKPSLFLGRWFYPVIAAVITVSVQLCGVYLVFASLVFPAVGTYFVRGKFRRRALEYAGAMAGLVGGLFASFYFDLATGPAIVWGIALAMGAIFVISYLQPTALA
ncbi:MAG: metal ABC transporter permease [Rickettsiales bacterium]|jgi:zinc/manganese transport system permease protein|nr:metal ABC transporter permease [Rickettsiales bacterium]